VWWGGGEILLINLQKMPGSMRSRTNETAISSPVPRRSFQESP